MFILRLTYPYFLLLFFDLFILLPPFPSSFHLCCKESFQGSLLPSCWEESSVGKASSNSFCDFLCNNLCFLLMSSNFSIASFLISLEVSIIFSAAITALALNDLLFSAFFSFAQVFFRTAASKSCPGFSSCSCKLYSALNIDAFFSKSISLSFCTFSEIAFLFSASSFSPSFSSCSLFNHSWYEV